MKSLALLAFLCVTHSALAAYPASLSPIVNHRQQNENLLHIDNYVIDSPKHRFSESVFNTFPNENISTTTSTSNLSRAHRTFDVERIGMTSFFLAIIYAVLLVLSIFRFSTIRKFVAVWTSEKTLYFAVLVLLSVRTLGFSVLSVFTLMETDVWYPLLAILFTLPEYCTISIYLLIVLTFLESFIFSHEQFRILNRPLFRSKSRMAFFAISFVQYSIILILYVLLSLNQDEFDDYLGFVIEWSCVIMNGIFPVLAVFVALYFGIIYLAGFPIVSPVATEVVIKVKWLFAIWTFGRLSRGVVDIISIVHNWQENLNTRVLSLVIFSILALCEFMPLLFMLDWSTVAVLLIGEDIAPGTSRSDQYMDISVSIGMADEMTNDENTRSLDEEESKFSATNSLNSSPSSSGSKPQDPLLKSSSFSSDSAFLAKDKKTKSTLPRSRIELSDLSLPRAFFDGPIISAPVLEAAAEASSSSSLLSRVGSQPAKQGPQVLADNGVWTTSTGFINENKQKVCVKRVRLTATRASAIEELAGEIELKSRLVHPNLATVLSVTHDQTCVYIIQEYVQRRSLYELLRQAQRDFSPQGILRVALQTAQAMEFAHSMGVIHGHLKSRNILLDEQMNVKVSDINIRSIKSFAEAKFGHRFFTAWTAPEVLVGYSPTKASDVYSFGVICWEMILRREPFEMLTVSELISSVGRDELRLKFPHKLVSLAKDQSTNTGTNAPTSVATNTGANPDQVTHTVPHPVYSMVLRCFAKPEYRPSFTDIVQVLTRCLQQISTQRKPRPQE